jgi:hypothetical protein
MMRPQDLNLNKGDRVVVDAKKKEAGAPVVVSSGSDSEDSESEVGLKKEGGRAQSER